MRNLLFGTSGPWYLKMTRRGLLLFSTLSLTSACFLVSDDEEREYGIPRALCGIEIERDLWEPLFPSGDQVRSEESGEPSSPDYGCTVWVDDEIAISLSTEPQEREGGVEEYIRSLRGGWISELDIDDSESVEGRDYEIRVWPRVAIAYADCMSELEYTGLITMIWVMDEGDHRDGLSNVVLPYADARAGQINPRWCDSTDAYF